MRNSVSPMAEVMFPPIFFIRKAKFHKRRLFFYQNYWNYLYSCLKSLHIYPFLLNGTMPRLALLPYQIFRNNQVIIFNMLWILITYSSYLGKTKAKPQWIKPSWNQISGIKEFRQKIIEKPISDTFPLYSCYSSYVAMCVT